jgi:hypothetical protein
MKTRPAGGPSSPRSSALRATISSGRSTICLAGRGVVEMAEAMDWLLAILKARGRTAAWLSRSRVRRKDLVSPYVAEAPDGPLVSASADFELGQSWFVERGPEPY